MRVTTLLIVCLILACPISAGALTGVSVGARVGHADYSGDIFPGSGDVGADIGYSVLVGIGTLPMLDFELRGSYFTKDFDYSYLAAGVPVSASFEYRDVSLTALAKKTLFSPPASPLSLYAGAGLGWHWINTELARDLAAGQVAPTEADDPVDLFSNNAKMSGEGVAGLKLQLPAFPLSAFGEARYAVIFTSERLTVTEFAGGLSIRF